MKKGIIVLIIIAALVAGGFAIKSSEFIDDGHVGVVYTYSDGASEDTLSAGFHLISPFAKVKQYPIRQQQLVLSADPADYNKKKHDDWHVDAPANGGMVQLNMVINYNFDPDKVVTLYKKFGGMNGEDIVDSYVHTSILAYIKEVTPRYTVMEIYSEKTDEVNAAITAHLNDKLTKEYGITVSSALIIKTDLTDTLKSKIQAKEEAKQDAEKAELDKQTALAQAEVTKTNAETAATVARIEAEAEAERTIIKAQSQADSTRIKAEADAEAILQKSAAITQEYIDYTVAQNWNGELPKIQSGNGATVMDVGNIFKEEETKK